MRGKVLATSTVVSGGFSVCTLNSLLLSPTKVNYSVAFEAISLIFTGFIYYVLMPVHLQHHAGCNIKEMSAEGAQMKLFPHTFYTPLLMCAWTYKGSQDVSLGVLQ